MAWRTANSIKTLHTQLRPLAPSAPATAFGTIGDTAHDPTSDHAPHDFPGWDNNIVTAGDFPKAGRLDPRIVLDAIRRSRDDRVKYGISNGQMFSSYAAHGYAPFTWRPYTGKDGHFTHGHLSVVGDARADNPRPWAISVTPTDNAPEGEDVDAELATLLLHGSTTRGWASQDKELPAHVRDKAQFNLAALHAKVDSLLGKPALVITPELVDDLADRIGAALAARGDNPLGEADKPAIREAVAELLRAGIAGK